MFQKASSQRDFHTFFAKSLNDCFACSEILVVFNVILHFALRCRGNNVVLIKPDLFDQNSIDNL